jgi:hypothetical protein
VTVTGFDEVQPAAKIAMHTRAIKITWYFLESIHHTSESSKKALLFDPVIGNLTGRGRVVTGTDYRFSPDKHHPIKEPRFQVPVLPQLSGS